MATWFRRAALTLIVVAALVSLDAYLGASGPLDPTMVALGTFAALATPGLLTLAAVDRISGIHPELGPRLVISTAVFMLLLAAAYDISILRDIDDLSTWSGPFAVVKGGSLMWLLLILGFLVLDERYARGAAFLVGSVVIVSALLVGLARANDAFIYPVHTFIQSVTTDFIVGLVLIAAGIRRWADAAPSGQGSFAVALAGLTLVAIGDLIWWTQATEFILPDIAIRQAAGVLAFALVGAVWCGLLSLRVVVIGAIGIVFATICSTISMLDTNDENRLLFLVSSVLPPIGLALFALASATAFKSNQSETAAEPETDGEGDFGSPLSALPQ